MLALRSRRKPKDATNSIELCFDAGVRACACSLPASGSVLFSDLGTGNNVYDTNSDTWEVAGSGIFGSSPSEADLFTVTGSGSLPVTQIDLAVENFVGPNTFYASIWTDNAGIPGTEVSGAYWSLTTSLPIPGICCGLVSVGGTTGVNLSGGQQYFLVLGPLSLSDHSLNGWIFNNQGVTGLELQSQDGGNSWKSIGIQTLGAFDILGGPTTPEPATFGIMLLGTLALIVATKKTRA